MRKAPHGLGEIAVFLVVKMDAAGCVFIPQLKEYQIFAGGDTVYQDIPVKEMPMP